MKRTVFALAFFVTLFGFGLITPIAEFESLQIQSTDSQSFTMSGIGDNTEDYVDQTSDLHAPSDLGSHSSFAAMQAGPDQTNDTLTETDTGAGGGSEWLWVDSFDATTQDWTEVGASPFLGAQDQPTNYIYCTSGINIDHGFFGFTNTTSSSITDVNISIYHNTAEQTQIILYNSTTSTTINFGNSGGVWAWETITVDGDAVELEIMFPTVDEVNNAYATVSGKSQGGPGQVDVDAMRLGVTGTGGGSNYELDLEVGWTAADFDESNEELCIFAGPQDAESLKVDVWNDTDSAWVNVIADLTYNQWNNVSIASHLVDTSLEIRFLGGTETGDTTQDTWEIDAVLIHTWTPSYAPVNDQAPSLDNPSDTDNMYGQYLEYQVTVYVSDQNGFADIDYLEIGLWDNTQTTEYCRFRYDEDMNTFTEQYDGGTYVSLNTGSSTATESGNDIDATFYFTVDWDFPDSTDLDAKCYVIDTQTESATTWYEVNWDVETRLDYSVAPSIDDASGTADRGDFDGSFSLTGTVIYYTSVDDFPASTDVDAWVSASEYGTTVGPWSDLTLISGAFDVTCYGDDVVGQDTYTIKVVEEGAGSGGTDLYYTTSVTDTYIADRVQVQSYSVADDRVNVNDNVDIDVTLYYDYDNSAVIDGTVTVNGASATHQGAGVWRITDSEATVMANTYNTVACSGGTHGITTVDQNGQSQTVIWDQVIVVSYSVTDNRVDINTVVNVDVTLQYDYDNTAVTDGTVTINTISATHQGSGVWRITPSQASVTAVTYNSVAASGNTHGITSVNQNGQSQQVIWDQITVTGYTVSDARVNINDNVNVDVTIEYAYDNTAVTDGIVTINGASATHQGAGVWRIVTSQSTVQQVTYNTVAASGNTEGITSVNQNGQSTAVIWDRISVQTTVVDDGRVGVGTSAEVRVTLWLEYDSTFLGAGDTVTLDGVAMTWDAVNLWFDLSRTQASVGLWVYFVNSSSETGFGITELNLNSQSVSVIWDRVQVQSYSVADSRVNINDNIDVDVTLYYDYDNTAVTDGTVTINGLSATHQGAGVWRATDSKATVQLFTYNSVAASGNTHGISVVDQNSQTQDVIWDRVQVQSYSVADARVNINDNVDIDVTLVYDYDNTAVTDGTVTINGASAAHQGAGVWRITDSEAVVMSNTYNTVASSGNTHGISTVDQNGQSQQVIWDQITVTGYAVSDARANINDNVNVDVTIEYAYDNSAVTDGTVMINGNLATHQGSGIWRIVESQSTVQQVTYNTVAASGNTEGITSVNQNGQSTAVVWDRISVQTTVVDDGRVGIGSSVEIRVTLWLEYDSTFLGAGDSVTLDGVAMTWDGVNTWFDLSRSQASVGLWIYFVNTSSEATYGITALNLNSQSVSVIWDRVQVQSYSVSDSRVNINDNVDIDSTLYYNYDNTAVTDGTVTINGLSATHQGAGVWRVTDSKATVQLFTYDTVAASGNAHAITVVDQNSQTQDVIWDRVQIQSYSVTDARVNINDNVDVDVTLVYDYDNTAVTDGTVTINGASATHQGVGVWRITDSEAVVMSNTYNIIATSGNTHGISTVDQNGQSQLVIWDQITVRSYIVADTRVNINDNMNIDVTIEYEYDDSAVTDGTVTINGASATHQGAGVWRITDSEATVMMNTYDTIVCSGNAEGITSVNQNSQSVDVIWDRIQVQSYSVADTRVNISDTVDIDFTLYYDYDNSAVTDGTVTVNGISATHQGAGVWRITDSEVTVTANTYDTVVCSGGTHGITTVDQNGQSQQVIWDQVTVVSYSVADSRVDINTVVNVDVTIQYDYDNSAVTDGTVTINGISATHQGAGVWRISPSQAAVTGVTYNLVVASANTHGITSVDQNSQSQDVIWDRVQVQSYSVLDARVNINDNVDINVTLFYDYDNTAITDGTVTINGISATHIANGVWLITETESTVTSNTYLTVAASGNTHGIDFVDQNGQNQQVIWDQITVRSYSVADTRVNVGDSVNIDVTIEYEYDDTAVTDGTVTINGLTATHQGAGVWRVVDSEATVVLNTYNLVACSANAEGITSVNQNAQSVDVIWDRVQVQSYSVSDGRVGLNDNVNIDVTIVYDYDNSAVTDGVVTINGLSASHQGAGVWMVTDSKATVQLFTYDSIAVSGITHGISVVDQNSQSVDVIWDQIVVQTTVVDDNRLDVSANAEIRVTLMLAYDNTFLGAGDTVTLDGTAMTWDVGNSWFDLTVSQSTVGAWTYFVNSTTDSTYGITSLDLNSQQVQVIWDEIVVQTTVADDTRVNMGINVEIRVTLLLAYDSTFLGAGDTVTLDGTAMTWDGANSWFNLTVSQASVGLWSYFVNSSSDATYGIIALDLNSQSVDVIWDRIVVQSTVVDDGRVDTSANAEVRVTLMLEYDSTFLGAADSVTLDGTAMTWDAGNSWFDLAVSQSTVGSWTYFVNASLDSSYGIDLLDLNGNSVSVIWDRVQVQSYSVIDDRVNIGDSVDVDVSLLYDYDDAPVTDGTITVNGIAATHQGAGDWRFSDSEVAVSLNTYNLVSSSGNAYGLTVVDQNSQTQDVIWDRLVIVIGVDDASSLNGHQANFTLTVTYDYDDVVCTTYQIVIDRNATWWHLFIDTNVSLFVDTNTDVTYLYNASLVSSESTYGITAFTTNTLQVTWSLAPNELPVNDSSPVLTNGDDTDYLYARYRYYVITTSVSDLDGYADISYVELTLYSDDQITQYWTIRYTVGTDAFSVESGGLNITVGAMSNAVGVGNTLTVTWHIKIGWDHADIVDSDIQQIVNDGTATDSDLYETNWNVETRLDYSVVPSLSDDRGDVDTADLVATGTITYYQSSLNPLSNETDVWVLHDSAGTWSGDLIAGSFSITSIGSSALVRLNNYTIKIVAEGSGSGGTDLYFSTSLTDTFITDRIEIYEAGVVDSRININSDCEVWWRARYGYDGTEIQSALTLELNGSRTLVWDDGSLYWRWQETSISPASAGFDVASASESTYGLTAWSATTSVQQVIWDALVITLTDPVDQRIDVGANATGIFVSAVYAFDGAAFDGSFTLNNTNFQYASPQMQGYTVLTVSGDTHGITAIQTNAATFCIWDSLTITITGPSDQRININANASGIVVTAIYEYDGSAFDGSFTLNNTNFQYAVPQVQGYTVLTASGDTHGITAIQSNDATYCIWDRVLVVSINADEIYHDPDDDVMISAELQYEYDSSPVLTGTFVIAGYPMTHVSSGVWEAQVTISTYQAIDFDDLTASDATLYGISEYNMDGNSATVYWDRLEFYSVSVDDDRINVGASTEIQWSVRLENAGVSITTGVTAQMTGAIALTPSAGVYTATITESAVGSVTYSILTASLGEIGQFIQSESDATVIWDQVLLTSIVATPLSLDIRTATEIRVTLVYEFDSTDVTTGVVNLDDDGVSVAMSYNSAGGYWSASVTKNTAGNYAFTVDSVSGNTHGISSLNTDGLSVEVEWVGVSGFVPDTMTLMLIGGGVGIAVIGAAIVASRRRRDGLAVGVGDIEPGDFGVAEPTEAVAPVEPEVIEPEVEAIPEEIEPEEIEPTEPEVMEEPEELVSDVEADLVDEAVEPEEVELPPIDEELTELEAEDAAIEPEVEVVEEIPEPEVPVDLSKLTKKKILDLIPDHIKETTLPKELKRLTKRELISIIELFKDDEG